MRSRPMSQIALHLDPQTLRVLVAIDDYQSFAGAAAAVNLVPSAISRRVQELETAIGFELVKRSPRAVEFTDAGRALLVRVRTILAEMNAAVSDLESMGQGMRGTVKIATSMFALHAGLPQDLSEFRGRYPGIDFDFETLPSRDVIASLQRGEVDVGIFAASVVPDGLRARTYLTDQVVLMVPAKHRLAALDSVGFPDFATEDLLQLPSGTDIQQLLEDQAKRHSSPLRRSYRVGGVDAAVAMTRAGLGLAIIPSASWKSLGPFRDLVTIPIHEEWSTTHLLIATSHALPTTSVGYRLFAELAPARK
jgi:DNA-binding transcriptional LysR family regulator